MIYVYTTEDGKPYTAEDGTLLVVGTNSPLGDLITDRTYSDVIRWRTLRDKGYLNMTDEERAEWDAAQMKGAYNPPYDMNRVGGALNYLRELLELAGYLPTGVFTAKTDWTASDIPTKEDLTKYLNYVSTVREALAQFPTTPAAPKNPARLDYQEANNIEKILLDVDRLITNMLEARCFCGELFSGEL